MSARSSSFAVSSASGPVAKVDTAGRGVPRHIVGFHQDEDGDWVAELDCGHGQHVRHDPPWQRRPWVLSAEERAKYVGVELGCVRCAERGDPVL